MRTPLKDLLLSVILSVCSHVARAALQHWDYVIVGAGPSGLQMAYFLHKANRDYVVLERTNTSGSFFAKYPRHGKLISINKRHTGRTNKEFNLRHDWNSLLSDDEDLLFKHYSSDFFPQRHALYSYLNEYKQKFDLNVLYNTEVTKIDGPKNITAPPGISFHVRIQDGRWITCSPLDVGLLVILFYSNLIVKLLRHQVFDVINVLLGIGGPKAAYRSRTLIMATGMWKPTVPDYEGIEHLEGYESAPVDPGFYEGKTVLILGHGNSAFETAESIYGRASLVHVAGRSRVRLAWETHYVGDLRSVNNGLLDTYQLKSLDGIVEGNFGGVYFEPEADRLRLRLRHSEGMDNFALRDSYDVIIRCMGFDFDDTIFAKKTKPRRGTGKKAKYPVIDHGYGVKGVEDMYIIGAAGHSLDFRESAGGFIHGFRYTARTLHRLLEWKMHSQPWPSISAPILSLLPAIVKRMNEASAIYQMFGYLGDIIILKDGAKSFDFLEEFPIQKLDQLEDLTGHKADQVIVMIMQYGKSFSGPGNDVFRESRATGFAHEAHKSNFLHPVFYYYDKLPSRAEMLADREAGFHLPRPKRLHHIVEDFLTDWTGPITHVLPLRRFLEAVTQRDLREFFSPTCLQVALTTRHFPLSCQQPLLTPSSELVKKFRKMFNKGAHCSL